MKCQLSVANGPSSTRGLLASYFFGSCLIECGQLNERRFSFVYKWIRYEQCIVLFKFDLKDAGLVGSLFLFTKIIEIL